MTGEFESKMPPWMVVLDDVFMVVAAILVSGGFAGAIATGDMRLIFVGVLFAMVAGFAIRPLIAILGIGVASVVRPKNSP